MNDLLQKVQMILGYFQWMDWVIVSGIILGALYGMKRGIASRLAGIFQVALIIYFVFEYQKPLKLFLFNRAPFIPRDSVPAIAFISIALSLWILTGILFKILSRFFHTESAKPLDLAGGALFGMLHFVLVLSLIGQAVLLFPFAGLKNALGPGGSLTGPSLVKIAPAVHKVIKAPVKVIQGKS